MAKKEENKIIVLKKTDVLESDNGVEGIGFEKEKIKQALIKKAMGFSHDEIVEEYVIGDEGEVKLSKRKITKKFSPPDIPAAKILLEEFEEKTDFAQMTLEELEEEKQKLLKELKDI